MILIKLNSVQAARMAGKYDKYHAIDPVFLEEDFFIIPPDLPEVYGIAKRYIKKLTDDGKIKILDTNNRTDADVQKLLAIKKESDAEATIRILSRTTKWDVERIINTEL